MVYSLDSRSLDDATRDAMRQERAPVLLDELRTRLIAIRKTALPRSTAGQAANYTLSLWAKLTRNRLYSRRHSERLSGKGDFEWSTFISKIACTGEH